LPDLRGPIETLVREIGPRPASSPQERRAARYLVQTVQAFTAQVWTEPHGARPLPAWVESAELLFVMVSAMLIWWQAWLAFGLLGLVSANWVLHHRWPRTWQRLVRTRPSQTVVAVIAPKRTMKQRVVLIAHYDTPQRASVPQWERIGLGTCLLSLAVAALGAGIWAHSLWRWGSLLPLLGVGVGCYLAVMRALAAARAPDPVGNASGVAVVLGVMAEISRRLPRHIEVWAVFPGAHGADQAGMQVFLDRHGKLLADATFIVVDAIGEGRIRWASRDGVQVVAEDLLILAAETSTGNPEWGVGKMEATVRPTPAMLAMQRGFRALPVQSDQPDGSINVIHLDVAVRFVEELLRRLDRQAKE
jgi:hypothetical protein